MRRDFALLGIGIALMGVAVSGFVASAAPTPSPVHFVLVPGWLPQGYSASGGGWVSPSGGLHVYPKAGASASVLTVGSAGQRKTPVLFTLSYYGFHNPESKSILLIATKELSRSSADAGDQVRLGDRKVTMSSQTEGTFHNIVTTASWSERGANVVVKTEGLTVVQSSRFIKDLMVHRPPSH